MTNLVRGFEYARAYLDALLYHTCRKFDNYLDKLEELLQCLLFVGLKFNVKSMYFVLKNYIFGFLIA